VWHRGHVEGIDRRRHGGRSPDMVEGDHRLWSMLASMLRYVTLLNISNIFF